MNNWRRNQRRPSIAMARRLLKIERLQEAALHDKAIGNFETKRNLEMSLPAEIGSCCWWSRREEVGSCLMFSWRDFPLRLHHLLTGACLNERESFFWFEGFDLECHWWLHCCLIELWAEAGVQWFIKCTNSDRIRKIVILWSERSRESRDNDDIPANSLQHRC